MSLPRDGLLYPSKIPGIILTLMCATVAFTFSLFAQGPLKERLPNNEEEKKKMVADVTSKKLPRTEFAYQALQEAQGRAEDYAVVRDEGERYLKSLEDLKTIYPESIDELKESAKSCGRDTVNDLKGKLYSLNTRVGYGVGDSFKEFSQLTQKIAAQPPSSFCDILKKDFSDLDQKFNAGLEIAIADVRNKSQWADELSKAWGDRAKLLEDESSKSVAASSLSRDLWLIVLVLGAFVVGLLALTKTFTSEIQMELVASGEIIQLPTVMLLLVTILILGLGTKIQENTIGTLLGGLAGYVLAQGVGRAAARAATGQGAGGAGAGGPGAGGAGAGAAGAGVAHP